MSKSPQVLSKADKVWPISANVWSMPVEIRRLRARGSVEISPQVGRFRAGDLAKVRPARAKDDTQLADPRLDVAKVGPAWPEIPTPLANSGPDLAKIRPTWAEVALHCRCRAACGPDRARSSRTRSTLVGPATTLTNERPPAQVRKGRFRSKFEPRVACAQQALHASERARGAARGLCCAAPHPVRTTASTPAARPRSPALARARSRLLYLPRICVGLVAATEQVGDRLVYGITACAKKRCARASRVDGNLN